MTLSWIGLYELLGRASRVAHAPSTADRPGTAASALRAVAGSVGAKPAEEEAGWFDEYANRYTGATIGEDDWSKAASDLDCEVAAIKAVAAVESGTLGAFWKAGWPIILYERHLFSSETGRKFDAKYPDISSKTGYRWSTKAERKSGEDVDNLYAWTQEMNYARLEKAFGLDVSAALKSASWGRFQILGRNHVPAGFQASVQDYVRSACTSEKAQLEAFVRFLKSDANLLKALQDKDWAGFAKIYNGKDYAKFEYDTRMKTAYDAEAAVAVG